MVSYQEHDEEYRGPETRGGQGEDKLRVGEEHQAGTRPVIYKEECTMIVYIPDHGGYREVVDGGHVAEDGEDQHPGCEAGAGVDHAGDQGVPVAVVVELVVGAQSRQGTGSHATLIKNSVL